MPRNDDAHDDGVLRSLKERQDWLEQQLQQLLANEPAARLTAVLSELRKLKTLLDPVVLTRPGTFFNLYDAIDQLVDVKKYLAPGLSYRMKKLVDEMRGMMSREPMHPYAHAQFDYLEQMTIRALSKCG